MKRGGVSRSVGLVGKGNKQKLVPNPGQDKILSGVDTKKLYGWGGFAGKVL